jgi:hypothetical protein
VNAIVCPDTVIQVSARQADEEVIASAMADEENAASRKLGAADG